MARKRGERQAEEGFPEPDLLPFLNIIFMLILALVSMAALLPLGVLSTQAQKLSSGPSSAPQKKDDKKPLNLTVFITEDGFNVSVRGAVKMGEKKDPKTNKKEPLVPNILSPEGDKAYDYEGLREKLVEFKKLDNDEESMTITADPLVKFDVIIQTMDASRYVDEETKKPLFPMVSFAAGLVG